MYLFGIFQNPLNFFLWQDARGCKIEHECAEAYGIQIIEEED